jgi:MYXO-CTERM domain-containing protein
MKALARIFAAAAVLTALTIFSAGAAHGGVADERGQRALERTLARERGAYPAPTDQAVRAAELTLARFLAKEYHAYPAPTDQQTANAQPAEPSGIRPPLAVVGAVGLTVVLAAAFLRRRTSPREAT